MGDLESCMAICPKGPDVSTFCVDVCRERCPATVESCPGKNVEACIGACPSDLKLFEVCVHSSEIRGLCFLKLSSEMLQNLPYFWNTKTKIVFFLNFKQI